MALLTYFVHCNAIYFAYKVQVALDRHVRSIPTHIMYAFGHYMRPLEPGTTCAFLLHSTAPHLVALKRLVGRTRPTRRWTEQADYLG